MVLVNIFTSIDQIDLDRCLTLVCLAEQRRQQLCSFVKMREYDTVDIHCDENGFAAECDEYEINVILKKPFKKMGDEAQTVNTNNTVLISKFITLCEILR